MGIIGGSTKIEPQYKKIYTKRAIKRGMSEALRSVDTVLKLDQYNVGKAVESATKDLKGGEKTARDYHNAFNKARVAVQAVYTKYKDWSPAEKKFIDQVLKELMSHCQEWGVIAENLSVDHKIGK